MLFYVIMHSALAITERKRYQLMKKKLIALLLLGAMMLTAVSCGGDDSAETTDGSATTTKAPTTTATAIIDDEEPEDEEPEDEDSPEDYTQLFIPYGNAVVDGTIDDSWANAITVTLDKTKTGTPAEDTVVEASVMWDENGIYFLFNITDSDVFQAGNAGDFNNDSLYLYISEDYEVNAASMDAFMGGIYQFALINKDLEMLPRKGQQAELENVQTAYTLTDTGVVMEFSYTPAMKPVAAGNYILLDYQYNDSGATGARKGGLGWYNGTDNNGDTMLWCVAKLLPQGEKGSTTVE